MPLTPPIATGGHAVPTLRPVPGSAQDVTVGAASAQTTNAISSGIEAARVVSTTDCRYLIGTNPTALATSTLLPAGVVEIIRIPAGGTTKIAFIQESAGGTANVTEMD